MNILAIETSCDETAVAIVEWDGSRARARVNTVSSQADLHAQWGGVVPDIASREHIRNIVPVIAETLVQGSMTPQDIDLIAVTQGPGLMPALVIGVSASKTLSLVWQKPLLGIQHLEGHIYANFLAPEKSVDTTPITSSEPLFPLIALIVSGGHTELVLMRNHFQYEILGMTQDDASGEAFDKVAKMLGLPYPGGPQVAKRADMFRTQHTPDTIMAWTKRFPRPMLTMDTLDFSFSGLKTAVLYALKKETPETLRNEVFIASICHAFQEAVVDVLVTKTKKALECYAPRTFVIAGGVSANERLRNRLRTLVNKYFPDTVFRTPEFTYSLDNAVMIGVAAAYRYAQMSPQDRQTLLQNKITLEPDANLPFQNIVQK